MEISQADLQNVRPHPALSPTGTIQLEKTLALTPAQKILVLRRDCVRNPGEREKLSSALESLTVQ